MRCTEKAPIRNAIYEEAKQKWPDSFPAGQKPVVPKGLGSRLSPALYPKELQLYTMAAAIHANLI